MNNTSFINSNTSSVGQQTNALARSLSDLPTLLSWSPSPAGEAPDLATRSTGTLGALVARRPEAIDETMSAAGLAPEKQEKLNQEFLTAIEDGRLKAARMHLERGADVNARDPQEATALHLALGIPEIKPNFIQELLDAGADVSARDYQDRTALQFYLGLQSFQRSLDSPEIIKLLGKKLRGNIGQEALNEGFLTAIEVGDMELARKYLTQGAYVNARDSQKATALHRALEGEGGTINLEFVEHLLSAGANTKAGDRRDLTPLDLAVQLAIDRPKTPGLAQLVDLLVAPRPPGGGLPCTAYAAAPLRSADLIHVGAPEQLITRLFAAGANIDASNFIRPEGGNLLHLAIKALYAGKAKLDLIQALVTAGAALNGRDRQGYTPLHRAVQTPGVNLELVQCLLQAGADVNFPDNAGRTSLHIALEESVIDLPLIRILVTAGAALNGRDHQGYTPLHRAVQAPGVNLELVQCLLQAGADLNVPDNAGRTPLKMAETLKIAHPAIADYIKQVAQAQQNYLDGQFWMAILTDNAEAVKEALRQGADINALAYTVALSKNRMTALHWAAKEGKVGTVSLLIQLGANVAAGDAYTGMTPLGYAIQYGQIATLEFLLQAKISPDSCLHMAAAGGYLEVLALLVQYGAKLDTRDGYKQTALHKAAAAGHTAVINFLIARGARIDIRDAHNLTPLQVAVLEGHISAMRVLFFFIENREELDQQLDR